MSYVSTDIENHCGKIIEKKKEKSGVKIFISVGCGGSLGALYPAKTFMKKRRRYFVQHRSNSNEFVHSTPKDFGENSIICLACHSEIHLRRFRRQNSEKKKAPQLLSLHGLKNLRSLSSEITLFVIHLMQVWITLRETSIMQGEKYSA